VVKYGKASNGKERLRWHQSARCGRTCLRSYAYPGCLPTVKQQIVERTLKGSGIREIARVLQVGPNTVLKEIKKSVWPLAGQHKRGGGMLSRRDPGRSAARGRSGGR
jgi:transposase-like protein